MLNHGVLIEHRTDAGISNTCSFAALEIWSCLNGDASPNVQHRRQEVSWDAQSVYCLFCVRLSFGSPLEFCNRSSRVFFPPGATRSVSTACPRTRTHASPPVTSRRLRSTLTTPGLWLMSGTQNQIRSNSHEDSCLYSSHRMMCRWYEVQMSGHVNLDMSCNYSLNWNEIYLCQGCDFICLCVFMDLGEKSQTYLRD